MSTSEYPDSPQIAVGAIVIRDNKVLLVKRGQPPGKGLWAIPGGRVELGETLQEAAEREIKEEVNLDFEIKKKLGFYESQREGKRFISLLFLGSWAGEMKFQESEISEAGWFTYDEAKELPLAFAYPEVIEDLHFLGLL